MDSMKNNVEEVYNVMPNRRRWYKYITVEPTMFLYMMAFMITNVIEQTFYVFRACTINHGYSEDVCYNINQHPEINNEVQETVSTFHQWNGIASHVVPLLLSFFIGSYSDKRGRKFILFAGLIGKLYFSASITLITTTSWPLEYVIYFATFPSALTGADLAIFAACFSYLADVSSIENRTLRVGILDVVYLSTMPTGIAIGNLLYNKVVNRSFTSMFAINTCFMVLATLHCLLFLKWQSSPTQKTLREAGVKNFVADFFDINNVKQTIVTLTKKRRNNRRLFLWFLLLSMAFYTFQRVVFLTVLLITVNLCRNPELFVPFDIWNPFRVKHPLYFGDERPVMYLYTTIVFGWNATDFSNFRTYLSTMYVLLMLFGIPLMTKVLKWRDTVIVMIGASAHITGHLIYAHATDMNLMYVGATAAALGPCVAPLVRSMTSKVLPASERGVAYAFLSVMENAVAMFASILYSQVYNATRETSNINAIFYLTMGTQVIVFVSSLTMEVLLKGQRIENLSDEKLDTLTEEK